MRAHGRRQVPRGSAHRLGKSISNGKRGETGGVTGREARREAWEGQAPAACMDEAGRGLREASVFWSLSYPSREVNRAHCVQKKDFPDLLPALRIPANGRSPARSQPQRTRAPRSRIFLHGLCCLSPPLRNRSPLPILMLQRTNYYTSS